MKFLLKIISLFLVSVSLFATPAFSNDNLKTWSESSWVINSTTNTHLDSMQNSTTDFSVATWWQKGIYNSIIRIARDLKNLFFLFVGVYFFIIVLRLLFSWKTEEEVWNFKKWVIWISVWVIVTQIAFYFVNILFDKNINDTLAYSFIDKIINPIINLLSMAWVFFFIAMMIYAFYRIITANWDEEKAKSGKMSVLYAAIWFIVIRASNALVTTIYWDKNLEWFSSIIVNIIDWMNSFVWIIVILLIIYAWFTLLVSWWDEEKLKKAKSSILYIAIWLAILIANYLILTFFILPESNI